MLISPSELSIGGRTGLNPSFVYYCFLGGIVGDQESSIDVHCNLLSFLRGNRFLVLFLMASEGLSTSMDILLEVVMSSGTVGVSVPTITIPVLGTLQGLFGQQASSLRFGSASVSLQLD